MPQNYRIVLAVAVIAVLVIGGCGGGGGGNGTTPAVPDVPDDLAASDPEKVETDDDTGLEAANNEFLVVLNALDGQSADDVASVTNAQLVGAIPEINLAQFQLPEGSDLKDVQQAVETAQDDPNVELASANWLLKSSQYYPEDGYGFESGDWDMDNPGGNNWGQEFIRLPYAWDASTGESTCKIGIIDFGFDVSHTELASNVSQVYQIGLITPHVTSQKGIDHGTHVTGIAAAVGNNGEGICGVAHSCTVECYWQFGFAGQAAKALVDAANSGCRVVNYSGGLAWDHLPGGTLDEASLTVVEGILRAAIGYAASKGTLFVQSAGNGVSDPNGNDDIVPPDYGVPFDARWNGGPGAEDELSNYVVVGNSTRDAALYHSSNFGPNVTVAAPGDGIKSCVSGNGYATYTGTSMSAPFVTGLAALCWSVDPSLTPGQVKDMLIQGAEAAGHSLDGGNFSIIDAWETVQQIPATGNITISQLQEPLLQPISLRTADVSRFGQLTREGS
ncbi:MAG: S8 family serine peptidase [Armatimonadota bacterium]